MATEFEKGAKIERWEHNISNPEAALRQVGALMVAESQLAFREQKLGERAWPARGPINLFGLIADFYDGKREPPSRRFEARPVLRDTGRLAASIAFRLVGSEIVEVGTNLPYAAVHQHGGQVESKPINDQVRQSLNEWLRGKGRPYRKRLGWLLNKKFAGKTLKGEVEARPFVGITKQTIEDVHEAVHVQIMEAG